MTSEWLGEMFEGDSADTGAGKFLLVSMGWRGEGLACANPEARTPIGTSENSLSKQRFSNFLQSHNGTSQSGKMFTISDHS
jgi:hypothetical protein